MAELFSDARNCYTTFYFLIRDSQEVRSKGRNILIMEYTF